MSALRQRCISTHQSAPPDNLLWSTKLWGGWIHFSSYSFITNKECGVCVWCENVTSLHCSARWGMVAMRRMPAVERWTPSSSHPFSVNLDRFWTTNQLVINSEVVWILVDLVDSVILVAFIGPAMITSFQELHPQAVRHFRVLILFCFLMIIVVMLLILMAGTHTHTHTSSQSVYRPMHKWLKLLNLTPCSILWVISDKP